MLKFPRIGPKSISGRSKLDAAVLGVLLVVSYFYLSSIDAFESLVVFVAQHEDWELDELLTSVALMGLASIVFSIRRYNDAKQELNKREAAEASVSWLAHFDPLTELPNRRMLNEFVRKFDKSEAANTDHDPYVIYSIDLDGFKKVNDLHGHATGDKLLKTMSRRLTTLFPNDLVVRLGNDEFVVIAKTSKSSNARKMASNMMKKLVAPMMVDGAHARVGASIGVVHYPSQVGTLDEGLRCCDIAMHAAKKTASESIVFFHDDMRHMAKDRALLETQLRTALSKDQIVPSYQPLHDLDSNEIYGFEVLARWTLPDGEEVAPSVFTALAEEAGMISDLSEKLLRKACRDAVTWPEDVLLSFNLSPTQLSDRSAGLRIINVLNETGFPPTRLAIEITESARIRDTNTAIAVLDGLQGLGIRVALDVFWHRLFEPVSDVQMHIQSPENRPEFHQ